MAIRDGSMQHNLNTAPNYMMGNNSSANTAPAVLPRQPPTSTDSKFNETNSSDGSALTEDSEMYGIPSLNGSSRSSSPASASLVVETIAMHDEVTAVEIDSHDKKNTMPSPPAIAGLKLPVDEICDISSLTSNASLRSPSPVSADSLVVEAIPIHEEVAAVEIGCRDKNIPPSPSAMAGPKLPVDEDDYYDLLGISMSATLAEVKTAYKRRAREVSERPTNDPMYRRIKQVMMSCTIVLQAHLLNCCVLRHGTRYRTKRPAEIMTPRLSLTCIRRLAFRAVQLFVKLS